MKNKLKVVEKTLDFGGKKLTLQTGKLAGQSDGAVLATYGETVVLATVVSATPKMVVDFLPLTVDYQEKLYAGGRIKGRDRKSTRLNSSHQIISYAVFCLKK